jgi:hypothetical protein
MANSGLMSESDFAEDTETYGDYENHHEKDIP